MIILMKFTENDLNSRFIIVSMSLSKMHNSHVALEASYIENCSNRIMISFSVKALLK